MNNTVVRKITFSRDMTDSDFRDMRGMFGHKLVKEGNHYAIIAFDDEADYLAFLVMAGQVKMTQLSTSKDIREI